jgi:hypothetical protein
VIFSSKPNVMSHLKTEYFHITANQTKNMPTEAMQGIPIAGGNNGLRHFQPFSHLYIHVQSPAYVNRPKVLQPSKVITMHIYVIRVVRRLEWIIDKYTVRGVEGGRKREM